MILTVLLLSAVAASAGCHEFLASWLGLGSRTIDPETAASEIQRQTNPRDRRSLAVRLQRDALERAESLMWAVENAETDEERQNMIALLEAITERISRRLETAGFRSPDRSPAETDPRSSPSSHPTGR